MSDTEVYLSDNDKSDIEISSDDGWESTDLKFNTRHAHSYKTAR